ncbi:activating signal cointegrator 1 complex subunit 1-like [Arctopsyche grandis]|uniref:activating signal cointegrator 1 complex subunit 1-like n=1 Tax=Arctopsyche grandis TaxID=121162 RepID=UPI00406D79CF
MDVTSPDLVWLDGRCHRINDHQAEMRKDEEYLTYDDKTATPDDDNDDDAENFEFVTCNNGRIKTSLQIALYYFGHIIGSKGFVLKRIMNETKTDIKMPPRGKKGDIVIMGPEKKNVAAAARRINMIVIAARKKQRPTHFLSIPTNSDDLVTNFNNFRDKILENPPQGVDEVLFTSPKKLHLTLFVMCLMDNDERILVTELLHDAKTKIIDPIFKKNTIEAEIVGVSSMNDDPKSTYVLYGEIKEKNLNDRGILKNVAEQLSDFFSSKGFESSKQTIKLHITFMNSSNRLKDSEPSNNKRIPFDASSILETYSDHYFGKIEIKEIHLSQMHTIDENGYYKSSSIVSTK